MRELSSYSIDELEALTGFDRRTVGYYSAEGLLPKVGRRGPKTRYSQEFVDRLNFIKRAKELQDAGKLPSVRLQDIARLINGLTAEQIVEGGRSNRRLLEFFAADLADGEESWAVSAADSRDMPPDHIVDADIGFEALAGAAGLSDRAARRMREPRPLLSRDRVESDVGEYAEPSTRSASLKDKLLAPLVGELQEQIDELRQTTRIEADERESMQRRLTDITRQTEQEVRQLEHMFDGMRELRAQIEQETRLLRDTLEELRELRQLPLGPHRPGRTLDTRARQFAKLNGLDARMLRVARLRRHPTQRERRVWEFPVDQKLLGMRGRLTVLCEVRDAKPGESEFVVLEIPCDVLADALLPALKKQPSTRTVCQLSAEDEDYLRGVNCPGLDANRYVQPVGVG